MKRRYRYRCQNCTPKKALRGMAIALPRIGQPISATGVRVLDRWGQPDEVVVVAGAEGEMRLTGLLWGFVGEATKALAELLVRLGIHRERAEHLAFSTPRQHPDLGLDWHVRFFPNDRLLVLRRDQIEELAQDRRAADLLGLPKEFKAGAWSIKGDIPLRAREPRR